LALEKFSVISTTLEHDEVNNIIKKKYKKNTILSLSPIEIKKLIDQYIIQLQECNIQIPNVTKSYIEGEFIIYETNYCGKNIIELGFDIVNFEKFKNHILKMLNIIKKAMINDIYFDPHPKNFVFNDKEEICYVDFYPPYSDNLKEMTLKISNIEHLEIIKKNYAFFKKDFLLEHFCGDFLNIDKNSDSIFKNIYSIVKECGLVSNSHEIFIEKAKHIRSIEDLRLKKNIYLL